MVMVQLKDEETRLETAAAGEESDGRQPDWQARYLGRVEYEISGLREDFRRMDGRLEGLGVALNDLREQVRDDISSLRIDVHALRIDTDRLKEDIEDLRNESRAGIEGLRKDSCANIEGLRASFRGDIEDLRKELRKEFREDIDGLRKESRADIEGLREDIKELRGIHRWVIASIITSIVGVSTTLIAIFSKLL